MTNEQIEKVKDLFGGEYTPEIIEDSAIIDFEKPIKGKYRCAIKELKRMAGTSKAGNEYDFYVLKSQTVEDIEGEKSHNRYLDKTYSNTVSEWQQDAEEGKRKLMNDLFTAGVKFDVTRDENSTSSSILEAIAPQIVDQVINVSAYPTKGKKQAVRIVSEFKLGTKKESTEESDW